jgi:hypothetical protein
MGVLIKAAVAVAASSGIVQKYPKRHSEKRPLDTGGS